MEPGCKGWRLRLWGGRVVGAVGGVAGRGCEGSAGRGRGLVRVWRCVCVLYRFQLSMKDYFVLVYYSLHDECPLANFRGERRRRSVREQAVSQQAARHFNGLQHRAQYKCQEWSVLHRLQATNSRSYSG